MTPEEINQIIGSLSQIYGYTPRVYFRPPKGRIRAEFIPPDRIFFYNPIVTTPYHEYGHFLYYRMRKFSVSSETFAQRFSTMWLTILRYNFRCKCGSRKLVPAHPKNFTFYDIWVKCLDCGAVYKLENKAELVKHYNP